MTDKICFVICPIGKEGSSTREWSDVVFEYIISPIVEKYDYTPIRADHIENSGLITSQIIDHLVEDDLVIADLTDHNPNVAYELAIRHIIQKPCIEMIKNGQIIPFDVSGMRTISYDIDIKNAEKTKKSLDNYIKSINDNSHKINNPIVSARTSAKIQRQLEKGAETNDDPYNKIVLETLKELRTAVFEIKDESSGARAFKAAFQKDIDIVHIQREHLVSSLEELDKQINQKEALLEISDNQNKSTIETKLESMKLLRKKYASDLDTINKKLHVI